MSEDPNNEQPASVAEMAVGAAVWIVATIIGLGIAFVVLNMM